MEEGEPMEEGDPQPALRPHNWSPVGEASHGHAAPSRPISPVTSTAVLPVRNTCEVEPTSPSPENGLKTVSMTGTTTAP